MGDSVAAAAEEECNACHPQLGLRPRLIPISSYPAIFLPLPSLLLSPSLPFLFLPQSSSSSSPPLPPIHLGTIKRIYPSATPSADMGNCASTSQEAEGKARSDLIDRQIEEDSKKYKRECKILLLGACPTPVLCPSEGMGSGKKYSSQGMFPTHPNSTRWVSTTRVAVIRTSRDPTYHLSDALPAPNTEHASLPYACLHIHTLLRSPAHITAYSFRLVLVLTPSIAFSYIRLLTRTPSPPDRFRRVRKVDDSQANEDHSPEWLLS